MHREAKYANFCTNYHKAKPDQEREFLLERGFEGKLRGYRNGLERPYIILCSNNLFQAEEHIWGRKHPYRDAGCLIVGPENKIGKKKIIRAPFDYPSLELWNTEALAGLVEAASGGGVYCLNKDGYFASPKNQSILVFYRESSFSYVVDLLQARWNKQ